MWMRWQMHVICVIRQGVVLLWVPRRGRAMPKRCQGVVQWIPADADENQSIELELELEKRIACMLSKLCGCNVMCLCLAGCRHRFVQPGMDMAGASHSPVSVCCFVKEFQSTSSYKNQSHGEEYKKERQPDSRYSPKSCYR
ncbi:hypothetical protein V8C43DRAFT_38261 [Trichoderma afarasin]